MAAMHTLAFAFLIVTPVAGQFGFTDTQFQDQSFSVMEKIMSEMRKEIMREVHQERQEFLQKIEEMNEKIQEFSTKLDAALSCGEENLDEMSEKNDINLLFDLAQNSTIEERVTLLELQVTGIQQDVGSLDEDVDFLFEEQIIQDERLLGLENRVLDVENNADDFEIRVTVVEEDIQGLQVTDMVHDTRISALENDGNGGSENDTIAFHAVLTSYETISVEAPIIFNEIILNEGNGYNSTAATFTVPSDGDGVYYFSLYLAGYPGQYGIIDMKLNDQVICSTFPDHSHNGDSDTIPGSCTAIVIVASGDEVQVILDESSTNIPLWLMEGNYLNGFNGFRI